MSGWLDLARALDALDRPVTIWWRDDDAGRDHPRLHRLLDIAAAHAAPVALAVVPAWLEPAAADAIRMSAEADILQHGHEHADHSRAWQKKIELGGSVTPADMAVALAEGGAILRDAFSGKFLDVIVPPWNRIDGAFVEALPGWGYRGLSTFGQRAATPGLVRVNTHLDVIDWWKERSFMGGEAMAAAAVHLVAAVRDEPIGLLTHHLDMDDDGWRGLDQFLSVVQDHPRARLERASALFEEAP